MQKPAFTTSIVQVFPGETIPPALLFKLHSENQSAMGMVVNNNGTLDVEKFDEMDSIEDEVKETTNILEHTKKFHRMLCFSSFPEKFDKAEVQPWIILKNSKEEPILAIAVEGSFYEYAGDGTHSESFGLLNDYLGPKIEEMYALLGNDPKKLTEYLKSSGFHKDLDKTFNPRAVFEFVPAEGEPFTYGKNEIGGEFTWGRASNVYGYEASAQESASPETAEPERKRSKYASDTPDTVLPPGVQRVPDKPVAIPPNADPKPDPIKEAATKAVTGHFEKVPDNLHGKRKKAFIRGLKNGVLPADWDNLTQVWVEHQSTVNSFSDLGKTAAGATVKDMKAAAPVVKADGETLLPIMSGSQQSEVTQFIKKFLDGNSNRVENPLEIQKVEAKLPVFTELAGLTNGLDDLDTWSTSIFSAFVKSHPEAAWLAILEYRQDRRKRKMLMAQGDKKLGDLTGTELDPTKIGTTEPVSPAPGTVSPPEEAPYKKSKYA